MSDYTLTGYRIARPSDYWDAMRARYPRKRDRDQAQADGRDHLGRYGLLGDYVCYRCGFLCDDGEE